MPATGQPYQAFPNGAGLFILTWFQHVVLRYVCDVRHLVELEHKSLWRPTAREFSPWRLYNPDGYF